MNTQILPLTVGQIIKGENCHLVVTKIKQESKMEEKPQSVATYSKYCPNVFVAKCSEPQEKGNIITMQTRYGKEHDAIVYNLLYQKDGFYYYSIVREDGFNAQEWAKRKAERWERASENAARKSQEFHDKSYNLTKYIPMGQPILVGHHSEKRHRRTLERSWNALGNAVQMSDKAESYEEKAAYWKSKESIINLSMPESIEYYEFKLEQAKLNHKRLLENPSLRDHSFSLTYAKKEVNELEAKVKTAHKLWA